MEWPAFLSVVLTFNPFMFFMVTNAVRLVSVLLVLASFAASREKIWTLLSFVLSTESWVGVRNPDYSGA